MHEKWAHQCHVRVALRIRQPAVIKKLEHDIEDVWVCFLHFIEQQNRVRLATDSVGKLASFIVTNLRKKW